MQLPRHEQLDFAAYEAAKEKPPALSEQHSADGD